MAVAPAEVIVGRGRAWVGAAELGAGGELAQSRNAGTAPERISQAVSAGRYFARVYPYSGRSSQPYRWGYDGNLQNYGNAAERITRSPAAGRYCVRIYPNGAAHNAQSYRLTAS